MSTNSEQDQSARIGPQINGLGGKLWPFSAMLVSAVSIVRNNWPLRFLTGKIQRKVLLSFYQQHYERLVGDGILRFGNVLAKGLDKLR